jgi:hypothetical protein
MIAMKLSLLTLSQAYSMIAQRDSQVMADLGKAT